MRVAVSCALLLSLCAPSRSTVLLPVDAADLVDGSQLIFTGVAVDRQVATSRDGLYPFTFITFEVTQVVKGEVAADRVTLRFEGGELGEEYIQVEGIPEFERGGRYLLFVADNGRAISPVVGWGQGKLELVEHPSRPGETLLLDRRGNAVEGIADGRFLRSRVERDGASVRLSDAAPTGIRVLEEVDVSISDPLAPSLAKAGRELVPTTAVLRDLRAMVVRRVGAKGFRPGALVPSLTIDDVPSRFSYAATAQ